MRDSNNIKRTTTSGMGPGKVNAIDPVAIACTGISLRRFTNKANIHISLLIFSLLVLSHQPAYSSGIGFLDYRGEVTVSNSYFRDNFIGIQATTTNAASIANNTIDNIQIDGNDIYDSLRHGIKIDLISTGAITIANNLLDNSYVPSTGAYTKNGRFGIRIQNHPSPSIANNTVQNFGRSGIQFQSVTASTVINNFLLSNGTQDYQVVDDHFASGIQLLDSHIITNSMTDNTIRHNRFSGIAVQNSSGTIGPNNIVMYNGDEGGIAGGGSITDCVIAAGGGGNVRGGVLAKDLGSNEIEICGNTITDNYFKDVAHTGTGTVNECGVPLILGSFFASSSDAVFYFDGDTGQVELNCDDPDPPYYPHNGKVTNGVINAGGLGFGIIIEGSSSDVTITNCTIKNAATVLNDAVTTGSGNIIGAGIFIANGAEPSISNNYITGNGWDLLDDRVYTEAGACGIQMRCSGENTSIVNNTIVSNANDGLVGREIGGLIGVAGKGNTFRNNGRAGIGLYEGTLRNLEIAYNSIYNNQRGIGVTDYEGDTFTIANNHIYSNTGSSTTKGGIGFDDFRSGVVIDGNSIHNNKFGIGIHSGNSNTDFSICNNYIFENAGSATVEFTNLGMGIGFGFGNPVFLGDAEIVSNWIAGNRGGAIGGSNETLTENDPTMPGTFKIINNTFINNLGYDRPAAVGLLGFSGDVTINSNYVYSQ